MRVLALLVLISLCVSALGRPLRHVRPSKPIAKPIVHTWHNVTTLHGEWSATLSVLNEGLTFVDTAYNNITHMRFNEKHGGTWGMIIHPGDDFNVLYAATFIKQANSSSDKPQMALKTCVFIISAYGPADPQIVTVPYSGGATCGWESSDIGENYYVN